MSEQVILLVEDNQSDEELTLRALRKSNISNRVVVMRDGAAAVDFLLARGPHTGREPKEDPAIVLLDLNLPKMGGLEVLRTVRSHERTKLLPIVVLTSSKEDKDLAGAYELGCNSYIVKPVDFTQFAEAVRQLGLYWLVLNQQPPPAR